MDLRGNLNRYGRYLRGFRRTFSCPACGTRTSGRNFENHCLHRHYLNPKRCCVWCLGAESWSGGEKAANADHLISCLSKFVTILDASSSVTRESIEESEKEEGGDEKVTESRIQELESENERYKKKCEGKIVRLKKKHEQEVNRLKRRHDEELESQKKERLESETRKTNGGAAGDTAASSGSVFVRGSLFFFGLRTMYHRTSCDFTVNPKTSLTNGGESGRPIVENRSSITVCERPIAENKSSITVTERPITENRNSITVIQHPVVRECSDSFTIAVRSELQQMLTENEVSHNCSVENIKFRLIDKTARLLGVSVHDLREYLQPDKVFIHPQVFLKLDSIFAQQKCMKRNEYTSKLYEYISKLYNRLSASDYNDPKEVQTLIEQLEVLAAKCDDCKIAAEIKKVLALDGLGDCSQHLKYPLTTHTAVRARPIGSDYDAGRVHVMAVRKMYESNLATEKKDVGKAINTFYQMRLAKESNGSEPELEKPQSQLVRIYGESVGSFADQVYSEVVQPRT